MEEAPYLVVVRAKGEVHQFPFILPMPRSKAATQIRSLASVAKAAGADWVGLRQSDRVIVRGRKTEEGWAWETA